MSSAVRAVGVLFVLILEYSERNMFRFLDDMHIVEALNEPVDNSGSEGDVSETEYSPFESDSNSGMWSHCIRVNFKTFVLIIAISRYFSNNNVTVVLYFTERLIITVFLQKMTLQCVGWSRRKHMLPSLVLLAHHPQAHQARGNVTPGMELTIRH